MLGVVGEGAGVSEYSYYESKFRIFFFGRGGGGRGGEGAKLSKFLFTKNPNKKFFGGLGVGGGGYSLFFFTKTPNRK